MAKKQKTKLLLRPSDTEKSLLEVLPKLASDTIIFICPKNFPIFSEINVLQKLSDTAEELGKKLIFVSLQKWQRDVITSQGLEATDKCPKDAIDLEPKTLQDFSANIPAQKNEPTHIKPPKLSSSKKPTPSFATQRISRSKNRPIRGWFFFGIVTAALMMGAIFVWISPSAIITVKPRISILPVTQNILVSLPGSSIPESQKTLPTVNGIFVETNISGTETFPATDQRHDITNAKGQVTLFNETSRPKFLIPSRLSTEDGVIVRFQKNLTIPPKSGDKPGMISTTVVADEYDEKGKPIGTRGNVAAGTDLFFPALRPESRELFYARANMGPLVGGSTLTHYFVAEKDFEPAKEFMQEIFHTRAIEKLRTEIKNRSEREGKKYVLLDEKQTTSAELSNVQFPRQLIGKEFQTFDVKGKMKFSGIVFDQSEVKTILQTKAEEVQDQSKKLLHMDDDSARYQVLETDEIKDKNWLKLSVSMDGVETLDVGGETDFALRWQEKIAKELKGKSLQDAKKALVNYAEIEDIVGIKVSPFWAKNLPKDFRKITLETLEF